PGALRESYEEIQSRRRRREADKELERLRSERGEEDDEYAKGERVRKAQGGQVKSGQSELGKLRDIINTIGVTDRADRDMRRLATTALSQWTAIDPKTGKITYSGLVGGTDPETGRCDAFRRA